MDTKGIDSKTKHLIYIGTKAYQEDETAIFFHVPMAKKAGASRVEIKETILLTLNVCRFRGINTCLVKAIENYDNTKL
jgi:alkylhydroperoxidase/carboxymuconolactone decarboxylase family protein YurZ